MNGSTRNQYIAAIMVSIMLLIAFWWWTTRTPTRTFGIIKVKWDPSPATPTPLGTNFLLQLTLRDPADRQIVLGKRAIITSLVPESNAPPGSNDLVKAILSYPFVISEAPPGVSPDGYTVYIGSLPKGILTAPAGYAATYGLAAVAIPAIEFAIGAGSLQIDLK